MNEVVLVGVGLLVGGFVGWVVGVRGGGRKAQRQILTLLEAVRAGELHRVQENLPGEVPALKELRTVLADQWSSGGREESMGGEALGRVAEYLKHRVEEPLRTAIDGGEEDLREWVESVLGAVEDMGFYLKAPSGSSELVTQNLVDLVAEVTQEFAGQFTVRVRVEGTSEPLRVKVEPESLKDALFLILHNAGEFGGGTGVEMTLIREADAVRIRVRDHGPGFSAEALVRAMDPFYTTAPGGLGLGLPYARSVVQSLGGELALRNPEDGGAEVEILLPHRE